MTEFFTPRIPSANRNANSHRSPMPSILGPFPSVDELNRVVNYLSNNPEAAKSVKGFNCSTRYTSSTLPLALPYNISQAVSRMHLLEIFEMSLPPTLPVDHIIRAFQGGNLVKLAIRAPVTDDCHLAAFLARQTKLMFLTLLHPSMDRIRLHPDALPSLVHLEARIPIVMSIAPDRQITRITTGILDQESFYNFNFYASQSMEHLVSLEIHLCMLNEDFLAFIGLGVGKQLRSLKLEFDTLEKAEDYSKHNYYFLRKSLDNFDHLSLLVLRCKSDTGRKSIDDIERQFHAINRITCRNLLYIEIEDTVWRFIDSTYPPSYRLGWAPELGTHENWLRQVWEQRRFTLSAYPGDMGLKPLSLEDSLYKTSCLLRRLSTHGCSLLPLSPDPRYASKSDKWTNVDSPSTAFTYGTLNTDEVDEDEKGIIRSRFDQRQPSPFEGGSPKKGRLRALLIKGIGRRLPGPSLTP